MSNDAQGSHLWANTVCDDPFHLTPKDLKSNFLEMSARGTRRALPIKIPPQLRALERLAWMLLLHLFDFVVEF